MIHFMEYFISIFIGTLILEDLALTSSIALIAENKISAPWAFMACFAGISLGDLGLYFIGRFVTNARFEKKFTAIKKIQTSILQLTNSKALTYSILISRMVPGTRLPTYFAAGFLKFPFGKFLWLTVISVFAWIMFAFFVGRSLSSLFMDHLLVALTAFLICLHLVRTLLPKIIDPWDRRALQFSWRQWLYFEFWPPWLFYIPVVPFYIYLSLKHRSAFSPFYANPHIINGGLIGESKWDFLKDLDPKDPHILPSFIVQKNTEFSVLKKKIEEHGLEYPLIVKPDIGQRGFGVRVVQDDVALAAYLVLSDFELLIQRQSKLECEAGIFFVQLPSEQQGFIFSITDKKFPHIIGDGVNSLGNLILKDQRAKVIASTYFARLKEQLDRIPKTGDKIQLTNCGNHCQGAVFLNGEHLRSLALTNEVHRIARQIPGFYFGRFDVRYQNEQSLKNGHFEIVEVNGAGAEATHIWDRQTSLREAYQTLFKQWSLLFEVGTQVKALYGTKQICLKYFMKECLKVFLRKEPLSVSS